MDKDLLMKKAAVNLMCCFIPLKRWRKEVRYALVDRQRRRKELLDYGFTIDADIITTPQGIRLDISDKGDKPLYMVKEVFVKNEYNLNLARESILIDIGMNRAAASLLFAADENIKRIYSYEPFKPTFDKAKKNLALNPMLGGKIVAYNCGLGKEEKTLKLPYLADSSGAMSTTYNKIHNTKNTTEETVVIKNAAKEISSIINENKSKQVIIKCDCEGAEYEIFEKLNEEGLVENIDVVIMEYHFGGPDRLVSILTENGFVVQTKTGSRKSRTGYIYAARTVER
jgi:FkbM family methyltransferase